MKTNERQSNEIVGHIMHETQLHIGYCETFGISLAEMQATDEHQGKSHVLDTLLL